MPNVIGEILGTKSSLEIIVIWWEFAKDLIFININMVILINFGVLIVIIILILLN